MLRQVKKFIASLLALALLLAPIEFVYAHESDTAQVMDAMVMQHDAGAAHHVADADGKHECGSQGSCSHCVYCSPALSHVAQPELEKPQTALLIAPVPADYSIDLPVHIRPPRSL